MKEHLKCLESSNSEVVLGFNGTDHVVSWNPDLDPEPSPEPQPIPSKSQIMLGLKDTKYAVKWNPDLDPLIEWATAINIMLMFCPTIYP